MTATDRNAAAGDGTRQMAYGKAVSAGFWAARERMRQIIWAHDFGLRELLLLDFINEASFGAGRIGAYVPKLDFFVRALEISRGNVSDGLKKLGRCLVIEERPQFVYGFRFPIEAWKVLARRDWVEMVNQLSLLPAPEHLRDALRETFVEQCSEGKPGWEPGVTSARPGQGGASAIPVPDSGTGPVCGESSRIGNAPSSPLQTGAGVSVPRSGTDPILQQCNIALAGSSPEQYCNVAMGVPESGTEGLTEGNEANKESRTGGAFDGERQRLFDELVSAGAVTNEYKDPSRPFWIGMVRERPGVVDRLLGELRFRLKTGKRVGHPGRFMNHEWHQWGRPDR